MQGVCLALAFLLVGSKAYGQEIPVGQYGMGTVCARAIEKTVGEVVIKESECFVKYLPVGYELQRHPRDLPWTDRKDSKKADRLVLMPRTTAEAASK